MSDLIFHFQWQICFVRTESFFPIKAFCSCIITGILISNTALAEGEVKGTVTAVLDGNTIEVTSPDCEIKKIVLAGVDSPELGQAFGPEAKKFLEKIILSKDVIVQVQGKDRFGHHLAVVKIKGKVDPRIELLKKGLAWTSEKNPLKELERYRLEAQRKRKGLWKQENPVPPWTYRREQTMLKPKSS